MASTRDQIESSFRQALIDFERYPSNLSGIDAHDYTLKRYTELIAQAEEEFLFCEEPEDADVVVRTLQEGESEFKESHLESIEQTKVDLVETNQGGPAIPICRFYFLEAPSSRDPLNITKAIFSYLFTYEQVIPEFLDFVFTFGGQDFAKEPLFGGLRNHIRLGGEAGGWHTTNAARKNGNIQICYNLKSPEFFGSGWSIRQTAVHHSFNLDTGYTSWIIIKGNDLIRERIVGETAKDMRFGPKAYSSMADRFGASFEPHLVLSGWAAENWRWYIKFLEDEIQAVSRRILWTGVPQRVSIHSRTGQMSEKTRSTATSPIYRWANRLKENLPLHRTKPTSPSAQDDGNIQLRATVQEFATMQIMNVLGFSFKDLQTLYFYDEKAKEASMVLETNIKTLRALKTAYETAINSDLFPAEIKTNCKSTVNRFLEQVNETADYLEFQQSRLKSLLQLITDRKSLLLQMLEYLKTNTSLDLSEQAQTTADRTQDLTEDMAYIAERTAKSTTSMKAITIITLLFLPGTFISTIMSTDIIRFHENAEVYSSGALKLYLKASLPLMLFSIVFWGVMYWLSSRREEAGKHRAKLKAKLGLGSDENV